MAVALSESRSTAKEIPGFLGRYIDFLRQVYSYRGYIVQSISRDLRKKYKRSSLGYFWSMLNPLLMITVLTIIFSNLLPRVENYAVFLFSALMAWQYFSGSVTSSMSSVRGNMNLIQQVPMPKYIFPVTIACSNLVDMALTSVALFIVMVVVGHPPHWTLILFPVVFFPLFLMTVGLGLLLSVSAIFFEDTKHLTKVTMQAWYYMTPILYGPDMLPKAAGEWLKLNPLYYPISHIRRVIYYGQVPDLGEFGISMVIGLFALALGLWAFYRSEDKFIYFV
jgi:ABC-type polysaccharide/polyol phosphate export permease